MSNSAFNTIQPLTQLLPLRALVVTLRFQKPVDLGFFHHAALNAFVRFLLHSPSDFNQYLLTEPLEAGHTDYQKDDLYRFRVLILEGGETLLAELVIALKNLPKSAPNKGEKAPFGPHMQLHSLHDGLKMQEPMPLSDSAIQHWNQLHAYDAQQLQNAVEELKKVEQLHLKFTTPARLRGPGKGKARDFLRNRKQCEWPVVQDRLFDTLIQLLHNRTGVRYARPQHEPLVWQSVVCFWLHFNYVDQDRKVNKLGGLLASGKLLWHTPPSDTLLAAMILGQYIGIGEYRSFGLGQYQLCNNTTLKPLYPRPSAAKSLLEKSLTTESIEQAYFDSQIQRDDIDPEDQELISESDQQHLQQLYRMATQIKQQQYPAPCLQTIEIEKPEGGTRTLSVPPWPDRVLQKATARCFSQSLDKLFSSTSFGYRRGHSRLNARDAINLAIRQGYSWILESDVASFFDSVQWENLSERLHLLLPGEPLIEALMLWVKANRRSSDGEVQPRSHGLPQGAPISPMLANLLLDDLDRDMEAHGHKVIRYADDFVILFKTQRQAQTALPLVQHSLAEHGLTINPEKTRIVAAHEGFRYLGYLFVDGYAIEVSKASRLEQDAIQIPPKSLPVPTQTPDMGERQNLGVLLTVAGALATLCSRQGRLEVEQLDTTQSYPWQSLQSVLLVGPHQITTPALRDAMKHSVAIHFANAFGSYQGVASSGIPSPLGVDFHLLQRRFLSQEDNCLHVAKSLVSARLSQCKSLIKKRQPHWPALNKMDRFQAAILSSENLDTLRGHEGQTAKLLWQFFKQHLDEQWQFNGRNRRPPKDPVNAMLSLGYTQLYSITDSLIRTTGLDPWQAAFHQNHGRHRVLASDLMEPFRHIVENSVLTLINRRQIKPNDFALTDRGCQMSSAARKTLLNNIMIRLSKSSPNQASTLDNMQQQIWRFAMACRHQHVFHAWDNDEPKSC